LGEYDTFPVRNSYGHIEYLTRQEIENLRDMGELGDVLSDRPSSKRPPFAKNPANQESINELFYEQQAEKQRKRGGKGRAAKGIASAVIGIAGAVTNPGLSADALPGHQSGAEGFGSRWKNTARDEQRDSQTRGIRGEIRAKGDRSRWSGKEN
jgi:hypothetical protein